jgi:acyl dehydratase/NAD(P)-dependent dehydrogenase (short-subunit alcohol dehydrogenase family)
MTEAHFATDVTAESARGFAELSGDWNPLHTDSKYAASTHYGRPILHGAFSAGLISRLAGMELPGRECLLLDMRLRFLAPIFPPASLSVKGNLVSETPDMGKVKATISDATTGTLYVDASYTFSRHTPVEHKPESVKQLATDPDTHPILVTGATGKIGSAVMARLGDRAFGVSRQNNSEFLTVKNLEDVGVAVGTQQISAIIHCGWPTLEVQPLLELPDVSSSVETHVAAPLRQAQALAKLLATNGTENAPLILIGSTAAEPGRHNYRSPLYSLSKSMIPTLVRILALELAPHGRRCIGIAFDAVGTINVSMNRVAAASHADRSPFGIVPTPAEAADQIAWVLDSPNVLATGATLVLSGGTIP